MTLYEPNTPLATAKPWSRLTLDYHRWLSKHINLSGYGTCWKGSVIHANTKADILDYHARRRPYLHRLTKPKLQRHLDGEVKVYFTGGQQRYTLVMIDIDCHGGEPDGLAFCHRVLEWFPRSFHQVSTNARGYHVYLVIDTEGERPKTTNVAFADLEKALRSLLERSGLSVGDVEVKGTIQHRDDPSGYYCGLLAKVPIVKDEQQLRQLMSTPILTASDLIQIVKSINSSCVPTVSEEVRSSTQTILVSENQGSKRCKCDKGTLLRSTKDAQNEPPVQSSPTVPEKLVSHATARRAKACWDYVKTSGYVPDLETMLDHIQQTGQFTHPWTYHESQRRRDVEKLLAHISKRHNPLKAVRSYNKIAQQLLHGHTVRYGKGWRVSWEDLSVFLNILDTVIVKAPNQDGSVPRDRVQSLWTTTARRKHVQSRWDDEKYGPMRDFLIAQGYLVMTDDDYRPGKAMRYTIGPAHPDYATANRIIPQRCAAADRLDLYDGYLLDRLPIPMPTPDAPDARREAIADPVASAAA